MSNYNIFGETFDNLNGFRLADTSGVSHKFFPSENVISSNLLPENIVEGVVVKIGTLDDDDCIALVTGTHQGGAGGSNSVWQDVAGQIHLSANGSNLIESLTVNQNGIYQSEIGSYNPVVVNVEGGSESKQIKFIDYDGSVYQEYTVEEFEALDGMPANPSHIGLVAQGWNWSRQDVLDYLDIAPDWPIIIGQLYITESGKTEIDIELDENTLTPQLEIYKNGSAGTLEIDWGDGTVYGVVTNSGINNISHIYSSPNNYTIKIDAKNSAKFYLFSNYTVDDSLPFIYSNNESDESNSSKSVKYLNKVKAIRCGHNMTTLYTAGLINLNYITIPNESLLFRRLSSCPKLVGVTFPSLANTQYSYSDYALASNFNLKYISICSNFQISNYMFIDTGFKYITCPSSFGTASFQYCNNLTIPSTLPSTLNKLPPYVFNDCISLTSIDIPSTVSSIGSYCFLNCINLSQVSLSSGTTVINTAAFSSCRSLTSIDIPSTVSYIGATCFQNCKSLTQVTLPANLSRLENNTFNSCISLTSIDIPSTVSSIGATCFQNCKSLSQVTLPTNLLLLYSAGFYGCQSLSSIDIPSTVSSIGVQCFQNCRSLSQVTLPANLSRLENNTFNSCISLTSIDIPSTVSYIGSQCFYNCESLTSIDVSMISSFGNGCFSECSNLTLVSLPANLSRLENNTFNNCISLTSIDIPSTVSSIGQYCFNGCSSLSLMDLANTSITHLGGYAFNGCTGLIDIALPTTLKVIDTECFWNCDSLVSIAIPSSVTNIGTYAFEAMNSLQEVHMLPIVPPTIAANAFNGSLTSSLKIYVPYSSDHSILNAYKTKTNWAAWSSYMMEESI